MTITNPKGLNQHTDTSERFWSKVQKTERCWLWTGWIDSYGYGRFVVNRHLIGAHRFAYELLIGPIPTGLTIDHLCHRPICVNPAHMEVVTNKVNILRGSGMAAKHARTTHCPKGHPYDLLNTRYYQGKRYCRQCHSESSATGRVRRQEING